MFQSYKIGWLKISLNAKNRVETTLEGIQILSLTAIEESEFLSALTLQAVFESRTYLFAARRCMNFGSKVMCETTFTATQCRPLNGCSAQDWTERELKQQKKTLTQLTLTWIFTSVTLNVEVRDWLVWNVSFVFL
jgi:hypothetical protein